MYVVQIVGGMGNQLFQYALGKALAHKHGVEFKLDLHRFKKYRVRAYALSSFNIEENVYKKRWLFGPKLNLIEEKGSTFQPDILNASPNSYLLGYWQSPKYFEDVAAEIRQEIRHQPREMPVGSVSLHIRRGDYITNPRAFKQIGVLPLSYYETCVNELIDELGSIHVYVFSDEPDWAKENLKLPCQTTVIRGQSDFKDLQLMSSCHHHIVANSSFSWWGAWLNPSPEKIVYAPKTWFASPELSSKDLVPADWRRR